MFEILILVTAIATTANTMSFTLYIISFRVNSNCFTLYGALLYFYDILAYYKEEACSYFQFPSSISCDNSITIMNICLTN